MLQTFTFGSLFTAKDSGKHIMKQKVVYSLIAAKQNHVMQPRPEPLKRSTSHKIDHEAFTLVKTPSSENSAWIEPFHCEIMLLLKPVHLLHTQYSYSSSPVPTQHSIPLAHPLMMLPQRVSIYPSKTQLIQNNREQSCMILSKRRKFIPNAFSPCKWLVYQRSIQCPMNVMLSLQKRKKRLRYANGVNPFFLGSFLVQEIYKRGKGFEPKSFVPEVQTPRENDWD